MSKIVRKRRKSKPKQTPTPYEVGSAAAATAVVGLVFCSLEGLRLLNCVSQKLQQSLVAYIAGLCILDEHPTACAMADKLGISHDRLTRLSCCIRFSACAVAGLWIGLVQSLGHSGWIIVDDVLLPHCRGKKMEGVYWDHDHAEKKHVLGMRLVVVLWTDGMLRIPLAFAVWHKKDSCFCRRYRSKNRLARILVYLVIRKGIKPLYVVFDAWYASKGNLRLFNRLELIWVTRIKKNCRLWFQDRKLLAKTIGSRLLKAKRPYTFQKLALQGRSATVDWGSLKGLTFVVVKDGLDEERPTLSYLISNEKTPVRTLIQRYKSRWVIEVFFRDAKQHLGFSAYQGRSLQGAIRHICLVFIAAVVLDRIKGKGMTLGDAKRTAQSLIVIQDQRGRSRLAVQTHPDWSEPALLEKAKKVVKPHLKTVCHLRIPKLKYSQAA
jgi:hypothetical protein